MKPHSLSIPVVGLILLGFASRLGAVEQVKPNQEDLDFFERKIRPVLVERCYECHSVGAKKIKGGLLLDSREGMIKGGDAGAAVVPGEPEKSRLIKALRYTDEELQMPPKHRLEPGQVADFEAWVKMGAPAPQSQKIMTPPTVATTIDISEGRKFWSFQPVKAPALPSVKNKNWSKHPVDRFILAELETKGLTPASPADKRTLIRRATFDLIGLPPTPEEVDAFLADTSLKSFEKLVDRLLGSSHYGERWGRHWLDVVRYADTSGCNSDYPVLSAYKYRNYVIQSFNQDKPYDQFLREQIAGDLLPFKSDQEKFDNIIATGYLAISRRFGSRANEFHLTIEDTIDNVGKAILGLSVSCARCHDHKYDPIPTRDYYALYGIFNSTRYAFPGTEIYRHPKDLVPLTPADEAGEYYKDAAEMVSLDDLIDKLQEEKKALERAEKVVAKVEPEVDGAQPAETKEQAKPAEKRTLVEVKAALEDARTRLRILESKDYKFEKAYAVAEGKMGNAKIQKKGDPRNEAEEAPRGFLQVLGGQELPVGANGSGRYELAQWLIDPKNPLTARVMANRIWQHHFGKGIVQTPNDFGARGKAPTHPELLDYLARRFIESGWSIKAMHKLIMLSGAYQMSSVTASADFSAANEKSARALTSAATVDPNNDYLWKFTRRRLSAEEVRDSMLAISGTLDRTMGGEHPFPPEQDWRYTQHKPFVAVYESNRRSVYLMQQRIKKQPYLEVFDGPDPNATTGERLVSTTPIQALFMMNAPFAHEQADMLALRVGMASREDRERISYAHQLAFGRPASKEEIRLGADYLRRCLEALNETSLPADQQARAALASYARVLFSSNEFMYVD